MKIQSFAEPPRLDPKLELEPNLSLSRTALDTKTSEFVSVSLDRDGVQCGHKGLYWFRQECPYVQWILLLLMLPCTGVLTVGVTSFRERERIPSLLGDV
jgi:hypothetical protein